MGDLKSRLTAALVESMKSGRTTERDVIRLIQTEIKRREIDKRITLNDADIVGLLDTMLRQRREAIEQFSAGGRQDLVDKEMAEIAVIQTFMPTQLSSQEVDALLAAAITSVQPSSIRDMAKVMAVLKPKLQGRTDMGRVSVLLKEKLTALSG